MTMRYALIVVCFFLSAQGGKCWWDEGHMIVAQIAALDLKSTVPDAVQFFEDLTKVLESMRHGKINSFVGSATWPDLVKSYKLNLVDGWHFTDIALQQNNPQFAIDPSLTVSSLNIVVNLKNYNNF